MKGRKTANARFHARAADGSRRKSKIKMKNAKL
jgi:hypothetical protein